MRQHEYTQKLIKTEVDVYGKELSESSFPGYKIVGFHPPEYGNIYVGSPDADCVIAAFHNFQEDEPRLILEKVKNNLNLTNITVKKFFGGQEVTFYADLVYGIKTFVIPDGYEYDRFDTPGEGENYVHNITRKVYTCFQYDSGGIRLILRKV